MEDLEIKLIEPETNQKDQNSKYISNPLLCEFPLLKPDLHTLNTSPITATTSSSKPENKKILSEIKNLVYEGKGESNNTKYLLGVFCKKKKSLTFIPVDYHQITKKVSPGVVASNNITINAPTSTKDNYLNNKSLLVQDFGTNKSRKVVEAQKSNIVKEENISSAKAMQEIIFKNTKEEELEANKNQVTGMSVQEQNLKIILPEFDSGTADRSKMFNISSSIFFN